MKQLTKILFVLTFAALCAACSRSEKQGDDDNQPIKVEAITVELGDRKITDDSSTRAVADFAVNKPGQDPTRDVTRLSGTGGWSLDVQVYGINGQPYTPGTGTFQYSGGYWVSSTPFYLPNYRTPRTDAVLYPPGWVPDTSVPSLDQSDATKLLNQDVLVQVRENYVIIPAHIPRIELHHKHSMLDFILTDVDFSQITNVEVVAASDVYIPCPLNLGADHHEYMVILPVGITDLQVRVTTAAGARYTHAINLQPTNGATTVNSCYCVKLIGLELQLSSVTVINWTYGTALEGQYTTIASYPTFRGRANETITLYYINGLSQEITFNDRGESTVKPAGRTIIRINDLTLTPPIILNQMYVDLTNIPGLWN